LRLKTINEEFKQMLRYVPEGLMIAQINHFEDYKNNNDAQNLS
jgi:hypothetical protein